MVLNKYALRKRALKKKKVFQNPLTVRPCLAIIMTVASAGVVQW